MRASRMTKARVRIEIADDGPGFSAEALAHATERFWRGDASRPRGGTGLGLAIARTMVEANGGRNWAGQLRSRRRAGDRRAQRRRLIYGGGVTSCTLLQSAAPDRIAVEASFSRAAVWSIVQWSAPIKRVTGL